MTEKKAITRHRAGPKGRLTTAIEPAPRSRVVIGLVGSIQHQSEIYVSAEKHGYVDLVTDPNDESEQRINIHVRNIDALIELLAAAKRDALEAWE